MKRMLNVALLVLLAFALAMPATAESTPAIDIDLFSFNRAMTYAQIANALQQPEKYEGQVFRAKGQFNYSEKWGIARIIFIDSSGCCEVAMEFRSAGELTYPDDYPPLYSQITVTGRWTIDREHPDLPAYLADAVLEWDADGKTL